jgi:site-specific recombinase XerD
LRHDARALLDVLLDVESFDALAVDLDTALGLVVAHVESEVALKPATRAKLIEQLSRFISSCTINGATRLNELDAAFVQAFVDEATSRHGRVREAAADTRRGRLWGARQFFKRCSILGLRSDNPADFVDSPGHRVQAIRPLTDAEVDRCRQVAARSLFDNRGPAAFALAEAGATTGEIARVRVRDVDFERRVVRLGAGERTRTNDLAAWGAEALEERVRAVAGFEDRERLLLVGEGTTEKSATTSVGQELQDILAAAGLRCDPDVQPRSIRAWAGRRVLEARGIEAAANFLGERSLDRTARAVHYEWRVR